MLEGEIREINLLERLVELWREKFTGAIRFENDGIIKILYFKGGDVLSASTNDRADSVDEILMRAGKVTRDHVKQALTKRKETETLGDALLNLGFITRKELTWGRRMQAISVVRSIGAWEAGSFTIVADYLPKREEGTIFPLPQLLTELIVTEQDRAKYERLLDSGSAVFAKMPGFDDLFRGLGLNEDAEAVVKHIDGMRSASELVATSGQEAFNSYKLLHALTLLGLLHRVHAGSRAAAAAPVAAVADDFGFESAGVSDAADAWSLPPLEPAKPNAPTLEEKMPAWESAPSAPAAPQFAIEPDPEPEATPAFGFDEAQVEAARRSTLTGATAVPAPDIPRMKTPQPIPASRTMDLPTSFKRAPISKPAPKKKGGRYGLIIALVAVFILSAAAYGGFMWWSGRQAEAVAQPLQPRPRPLMPKPVVPPPTETIAEATTGGATPVSGGAPPTQTVPLVVTPAQTTATAAPTPALKPPAPKPPAADTAAVPPTPASGDFSDRAREFAANAKGSYTVQFGIMCDPGNVRKALTAGGARVGLAPISLKGRACYRLFWGDYATREAAEAGMADLPQVLRESKPAVVSIPR